jgi:hypothetical protein
MVRIHGAASGPDHQHEGIWARSDTDLQSTRTEIFAIRNELERLSYKWTESAVYPGRVLRGVPGHR